MIATRQKWVSTLLCIILHLLNFGSVGKNSEISGLLGIGLDFAKLKREVVYYKNSSYKFTLKSALKKERKKNIKNKFKGAV